MSIETKILESHSQVIALEDCEDRDVSQVQLEALQEQDVRVVKGVVRIAGAKVEFTHLQPAEVTEETDLGIVNGFCGSAAAYKKLAVETALKGRNVFYIRPPRTQALLASLQPGHLFDVLRLQEQATWGAMKTIREQTDRDEFDLYGHSMGLVIAAGVASRKPGNVRSLTSAGGAGLVGNITWLEAAQSAVQLGRHDIPNGSKGMREHASPDLIWDSAYHIFRRVDRTAREGLAVARIDIRPSIETARDSGIRFGGIIFEKDGIFNADKVMTASGHLFDNVLRIPGASHVYPQDHPIEHSHDVIRMSDELNYPAELAHTG